MRSIGGASKGEAKRMLHRLWQQTELVFMYVRANPELDRAAILRVVADAIDWFGDQVDDSVAGITDKPATSVLDEPCNIAARMRGTSLAAKAALDRCDVSGGIPLGRQLCHAVLGNSVPFDQREERRLARAAYEGITVSADRAAPMFDTIAAHRPPSESYPAVVASGALDATPDDIARLRALKRGDNIGSVIALETLETACAAGVSKPLVVDLGNKQIHDANKRSLVIPPSPCDGNALDRSTLLASSISALTIACQSQASFLLINADMPLSEFWKLYGAHKVEQGDWSEEERAKAESVRRLIIDVCGDQALCKYTPQDMNKVRSIYRALPAKYAQEKHWVKIYQSEGPSAVAAAACKNKSIKLTKGNTWNKIYYRINGAFIFGKYLQGAALPKTAENPCEGLFLETNNKKRKLTRAQRNAQRRVYTIEELELIFNSTVFLGVSSESRWASPGQLVFRNHRFWLVLIGFLHGTRREEPIVLKVKHVRQCPVSGIWYFDFEDPELTDLLKGEGSPRLVPLHWMLIALGFLEARVIGRDPEERLLPEACTTAVIGGDGGPFGQWFFRFRRSLGITDDKAGYHAARTTVINLLEDAGVPDSHIEALCGHESRERRSAIDEYKRPKKLLLLKAAVDQVVMPIDIAAFAIAQSRSDAVDRGAAWPDLSAPRKWVRGQK